MDDDNPDLDKFDLEQAQKILANIKYIGDLREFKVPSPYPEEMRKISLKEWVQWYNREVLTELNLLGGSRHEMMFLPVISAIDEQLQTVVNRSIEGYRLTLTLIERKDRIIKKLREELKETKMEKEEEPEEQAPEPEVEDAVEEPEIDETIPVPFAVELPKIKVEDKKKSVKK